jgi:uncharacterized OB-fold protein
MSTKEKEEPMTQTTDYNKPVPIPDEASKPFFDGAREHLLLIQQCLACGAVMWPVKSRCTNCLRLDVTWIPASGRGTLYSFALMHQVYHPGFASEAPYNVAQVDLEEGLRILTNIVGCSNADLHIGMSLEVTFEEVSGEVTLPKFKPVG